MNNAVTAALTAGITNSRRTIADLERQLDHERQTLVALEARLATETEDTK